MIRNFSDHSANERTFLAWVRTAIAVMAFGFLVEKFDLFLEFAAPSLAGRTLSLPGQKFGVRRFGVPGIHFGPTAFRSPRREFLKPRMIIMCLLLAINPAIAERLIQGLSVGD